MSKAGLIFVGCCAAIAIFFLIPALGMPGGTSDGAPGPGYFPIIVSLVILVLCVLLVFKYLKDDKKYFQQTETQRKNLPKLLITAGAIVLYTILFMFVPFIPLTIVFMVFLNWYFGKKWVYNIVFSIVFTLVLYFVFSKFLHVML